MSDWVVIAWKKQPDDHKISPFSHRRITHNSHYTPVRLNNHIPAQHILFIARTSVGRVPVFDAIHIGSALHIFATNAKTSYQHSSWPFRPKDPPRPHLYVVKPYEWLLDQFVLQGIHGVGGRFSV